MRVQEAMTFDEYWQDARFTTKRPFLGGSMKYAFGDNIYHHDATDQTWIQENSHHSHADGSTNLLNLETDTHANRVLVSDDFTYWGGDGPVIPPNFNQLIARRGHKCNFSQRLVDDFLAWCQSSGAIGRVGVPLKWNAARTGARRRSAA